MNSVKTAFKSAVRLAGLGPRISPHIATHGGDLAQAEQAAGFLGMSLKVLLNTYGHHHPDYLSDAVEKIARRELSNNKKRTYLVQ